MREAVKEVGVSVSGHSIPFSAISGWLSDRCRISIWGLLTKLLFRNRIPTCQLANAFSFLGPLLTVCLDLWPSYCFSSLPLRSRQNHHPIMTTNHLFSWLVRVPGSTGRDVDYIRVLEDLVPLEGHHCPMTASKWRTLVYFEEDSRRSFTAIHHIDFQTSMQTSSLPQNLLHVLLSASCYGTTIRHANSNYLRHGCHF